MQTQHMVWPMNQWAATRNNAIILVLLVSQIQRQDFSSEICTGRFLYMHRLSVWFLLLFFYETKNKEKRECRTLGIVRESLFIFWVGGLWYCITSSEIKMTSSKKEYKCNITGLSHITCSVYYDMTCIILSMAYLKIDMISQNKKFKCRAFPTAIITFKIYHKLKQD